MSRAPNPSFTAVVARYSAVVAGLRWTPLGSAGGLSGASIWRGDDPTDQPCFALKAWPAETTRSRLEDIHRLIAPLAHLTFVPSIVAAIDHSTALAHDGRMWDLSRWMPGVADFHAHPTALRLSNAMAAVAAIHGIWSQPGFTQAPCPGVARRLQVLSEWHANQWRFHSPFDVGNAELNAALRRAAEAVRSRVAAAETSLRIWAATPMRVHPCLCDLRRDHVLFVGEDVSGVIDFGAAKPDHVAVDLARLLGEIAGEDDAMFAAGLCAYRAAGGFLDVPDECVRVFDRTGVVCSLAAWLLKLVVEKQCGIETGAAARRIDELSHRLTSRLI